MHFEIDPTWLCGFPSNIKIRGQHNSEKLSHLYDAGVLFPTFLIGKHLDFFNSSSDKSQYRLCVILLSLIQFLAQYPLPKPAYSFFIFIFFQNLNPLFFGQKHFFFSKKIFFFHSSSALLTLFYWFVWLCHPLFESFLNWGLLQSSVNCLLKWTVSPAFRFHLDD